MFNFLIAGIGALASYNAQKRAAKAQEAAYQRQLEQDRKNRELAKQDAANKFVDMGKAADKAGINRLTALRATGGAGFGMYGGYTAQAPVISRANFIETFGGSMLKTWATNKINAPIDKYNAEVRKLDLEARKLDIKLGRKQLEGMKNPYDAYGDTIPVRVGNNTQQLDVTVARRLGILPNDRITAGDLEEIRGEIHGGIQAGVESDIGGAILPRTPAGNTPVGTNWMDNFVGKMTNIINSMPNTPIVPPLSDKRWNDEWKNYVN